MTVDLSGGVDPAREYAVVTPPEEKDFRDAVNVWVEEADGRFGMRIGVEAVSHHWDAQMVWLDIAFANGRVLSCRNEDAAPHDAAVSDGTARVRGAGPLRFELIEPFAHWKAAFDGEAQVTTTDDLIAYRDPPRAGSAHVRFQINMRMAVPPLVSGTMDVDASAIMQDDPQGQFISPRYEQLFRCTGWLEVDGERQDFTGQGLRIRRTGFRAFDGFWGHCWQSALFSSGKAFGYNRFPPREDGKPSFAEGFVYFGKGPLIPARPVGTPWMRTLVTGGEHVPLELETAEGIVRIEGTSYVSCRSRGSVQLPPDFPIVQQSHCFYEWEGERTTGMMERSTKPSDMHGDMP